MPCDIIYGKIGAEYNRQHHCLCEYFYKLRINIMVSYVCACLTMGMAASRQRVYHDKDTATHFFKPGDWFLYWNKARSLQTLSCDWTGPYVMMENVSPVDYTIQFALDGKEKMVYCDELQRNPCSQDWPSWIKDQYPDGSDSVRSAQTMPWVPIAIHELLITLN